MENKAAIIQTVAYTMAMQSFDDTIYLAKESGYSRKAWHNKPSGVAKAKRAKQKRKNKS